MFMLADMPGGRLLCNDVLPGLAAACSSSCVWQLCRYTGAVACPGSTPASSARVTLYHIPTHRILSRTALERVALRGCRHVSTAGIYVLLQRPGLKRVVISKCPQISLESSGGSHLKVGAPWQAGTLVMPLSVDGRHGRRGGHTLAPGNARAALLPRVASHAHVAAPLHRLHCHPQLTLPCHQPTTGRNRPSRRRSGGGSLGR